MSKKQAGLPPRENGTKKGLAVVKRFARDIDARLIVPARFTRGERTVDLDALVIGYFGILGVRLYGYEGTVYGNASGDNWLLVTPAGERLYFADPVAGCSADMRGVRDVLFESKMKTVPVTVLHAFVDAKVQIAVPRSMSCMDLKSLRQELGRESYRQDIGLDLDAAESAFRSALGDG